MNNTLFILSIKGSHSKTTRAEFISGLQSRGATVTFRPSRLGDFEVVRVNEQPVARAFQTLTAMLEYMADRMAS